MSTQEFDVDFEKLFIVRMPNSSRNHRMYVNVNRDGFIIMNSVLLRDVKEKTKDMEFIFMRSEDYKTIAFVNKKDQENRFKFHNDGKIRHADFVTKLGEFGYMVPAKYIMEWDERRNAWIGRLEEIPELKDPQSLLKTVSSKTKAGVRGRKNV